MYSLAVKARSENPEARLIDKKIKLLKNNLTSPNPERKENKSSRSTKEPHSTEPSLAR